MYWFLKFTNPAGAEREYPIGAVYARYSDAQIKQFQLIERGNRGVKLIRTEDPAGKDIIVEVERVFA